MTRPHLILEPVCEYEVTQVDAVAACTGYQNPLVVPPVGTHTTVTGPWVHDADHGWNEIHPVEGFGGRPAPSIAPATPPAAPPPPAALTVRITDSHYGLVAATTAAGASCAARAVLPSGRTSTAAGLQVQETGAADGSVSWPYRTVSTTTPGTGTHTVTCTLDGFTASASAPFTVP